MLPCLLVLPLLYLRGLQAGPAEHGLISKLLEQVLEDCNPSLKGLSCLALQCRAKITAICFAALH